MATASVLDRTFDDRKDIAWESEQTVLVVDRRGRIVHADNSAHALLHTLGLTHQLQPTEQLHRLICAVWQRYDAALGRAIKPQRADVGNGWMVRVSYRRTSAGKTHAVLVFNRSARAEALARLAATFGLTRRETEVVSGVLQGGSTKEIAARLCLSRHTVQDHFKTVYAKCGVTTRLQLTALLFGQLDAASL